MKTRKFFKLYQRALDRWPYLMQAIQTGTLMGTGDIIAQTFIEKAPLKNIDYMRTVKFSSIGFFVGGPALRVWYAQLTRLFGSSGRTTAIKKVVFDQALFAPVFLLLLLTAVASFQGKSWNIIKQDLQSNYLDVLKTNYYIWPWVQLVNFYYVPLQYQVLLVQVVALFWNTYLSWKTNRNKILQ